MTKEELIRELSYGDPDTKVRLLVPSGHLLPIQYQIAFSYTECNWNDDDFSSEGAYLVAGDVEPLAKSVLGGLFTMVNPEAVGNWPGVAEAERAAMEAVWAAREGEAVED